MVYTMTSEPITSQLERGEGERVKQEVRDEK
jgi:hypothetical protein